MWCNYASDYQTFLNRQRERFNSDKDLKPFLESVRRLILNITIYLNNCLKPLFVRSAIQSLFLFHFRSEMFHFWSGTRSFSFFFGFLIGFKMYTYTNMQDFRKWWKTLKKGSKSQKPIKCSTFGGTCSTFLRAKVEH